MPKSKPRKKKPPKRVLALPDPRTRQDGGAEQPDIRQRPAHLRPRHPRVRRLVLLGAPARVQPHRRAEGLDPRQQPAVRRHFGEHCGTSLVGRSSRRRVYGSTRRSDARGHDIATLPALKSSLGSQYIQGLTTALAWPASAGREIRRGSDVRATLRGKRDRDTPGRD